MATTLQTLLQQFLRERKYLRNVSPQTIEWYETAWKAFCDSATHCPTDPGELNRAHLEQFVYALRERNVRPVTCNTWLKALNAFFRWLHEQEHLPTRVHLRPLKVERWRVHALACALLDTGCRVQELLDASALSSDRAESKWTIV